MHSDIIKGVGENIWVKHPYGRRKGGERSEPTAASRPSNRRAQRVILLVDLKCSCLLIKTEE